MQAQITAHQLRTIAGPQFVRGEAYWRQGRVLECVVGNGVIDGVVSGSFEYRVRVWSSAGRLLSSCTCPVGTGMCKHAVALVLFYLGDRAELPPPEPITGAFATRAELEAFVAEHHVMHVMPLTADILCAELTIPPGAPPFRR